MERICEGGCVCGDIRYRVRGEATVAFACHCTFCQRASGSAFSLEAFVPEAGFEWLCGEPSVYEHRSDESGRRLRVYFCPRCGTRLVMRADARPGRVVVFIGTLDDPDHFTIDRHFWVRSKRPWVVVPEGVSTYPSSPPAVPGRAS